ncbi:DoxX family protein [Rhodophyticola sp. CCM32]|uniref:DoxX family protein n=1 Tax=Rhodophyticola sp. CCM32 TaxID=2916397 RepID=UPI00107FA534|nr:DoxX family protein [Rhodophyticola sp. CCM32]QBY00453.1 DoxX family protein [Rhodophyticola sp. CCM32]
MVQGTANRVTNGKTAQNLLRILIASYFLAAALQLIPGTDLTPLTSRVMPPGLDAALAAAIVFGLAYLVMIGVWMRGAALLLGLMTFFASYIKMLELGLQEELGDFWRDLALIAALMLTYADKSHYDPRLNQAIRRRVRPRRVQSAATSASQRMDETTVEGSAPHPAAAPARKIWRLRKDQAPIDIVFREPPDPKTS